MLSMELSTIALAGCCIALAASCSQPAEKGAKTSSPRASAQGVAPPATPERSDAPTALPADSGSRVPSPPAAPKPLAGIYEVTGYQKSQGACDQGSLQDAKAPAQYFYFAKSKNDSWAGWGCDDVAACREKADKFIKTGARGGKTNRDVGSFDTRDGEVLRFTLFVGAAGQVVDGKCTELTTEQRSGSHSGDTLRTEIRKLVYEPFRASGMSDCTTIDARDKKMKLSCTELTVWQGKWVSALK